MAVSATQEGQAAIIPTAGDRVWRLFWRLDRRRNGNGYAANAISPSEIEAAVRATGETLRPWEVRALDAMEAVRLGWINRDVDGENSAPVAVDQPVTPVLVNALFGSREGN